LKILRFAVNTQSQEAKKPDPPFFPAQLPWYRKLYDWHRARVLQVVWVLAFLGPLAALGYFLGGHNP
jgi:hypothetical protein